MPERPDRHLRSSLPIPDRPQPGLTTYDAKDPDTSYPPIEPLLPPEGAPKEFVNVVFRRVKEVPAAFLKIKSPPGAQRK